MLILVGGKTLIVRSFSLFWRRIIAFSALATLFFAQLTLAASACEMYAPAKMEDCMEAGGHNTPLCHAHCDTPRLGLDHAKLPAVASLQPPVLVFLFDIPLTEESALEAPWSAPRTGAPPLQILHCSLLT